MVGGGRWILAGMRHRPQRLGEALAVGEHVCRRVVVDLVADRALARIRRHHLTVDAHVAVVGLGERHVGDPDAERHQSNQQQAVAELDARCHGTSDPENASADAATMPAAATTNAISSRSSVSITSARANTNGTVDNM